MLSLGGTTRHTLLEKFLWSSDMTERLFDKTPLEVPIMIETCMIPVVTLLRTKLSTNLMFMSIALGLVPLVGSGREEGLNILGNGLNHEYRASRFEAEETVESFWEQKRDLVRTRRL